MTVPRMRTLPEAYAEIKKADPSTAYTLRALRSAVNKGEIPVTKVGNKRLINLDKLYEILNTPSYCKEQEHKGIRKVI